MSEIAPKLLLKFNRQAPRYTSYPTAVEWETLKRELYEQTLSASAQEDLPLSLYFHIPFCKTMCLYCGCSVVLNRKEENEVRYVDYLIKEIELVSSLFGNKKKVTQLHFGGGTPTKLSIPLFERLFRKIEEAFAIDFTQELAIEIDPRTVYEDSGEKLHFLRKLGFNRVSFGVQDTDAQVQEAVKRRQSLEMTEKTYALARSLGFRGINIDLIYGLPYQSVHSFETTVSHILSMRPDRIAFFSYAKVPWLKPHQRAIPEKSLPSVEEKFQIYAHARARFIENGYQGIGMDHFALKHDSMATAYYNKTLQRNFQGYSLKLAEQMLGFGMTSVGFTQNTYFQNHKDLKSYYESLDQNILPIYRGKQLNADDQLRKWTIHTLMCDFELDKQNFSKLFHVDFDTYFENVSETLIQHEADGLIFNDTDKIRVTPLGELFIRIVATSFDAYLSKSNQKFSHAI